MNSDNTICFLNTVRTWGGGEKWHFEMAAELRARGYPVLFIAHPDSVLAARLDESGIPAVHAAIGKAGFVNPCRLLTLARTFRRHHVDTLIINFPPDLKAGGIAAKLAGVRRIVYRRGSAIPIRDTFLNRLLFGSVLTDVIANSAATRDTILQNNPRLFPRDKIRVMYNGIDIDDRDGRSRTESAGIRDDCTILGAAGRLAPEKGHELLIDVAQALREKGIRFRLLIAGSGPLEARLQERIQRAQLQDCVLLSGFVSDIRGFMNSIDIFVLPSRWEGFGFVLVEAMSCSKPVVAWNVSSIPELVDHGVNGFLAAPFDTEQFAGYVIELINDPAKAAAMGERGYRIAGARFSLDRSVDQFIAFLNS